MKRSAPLKRNKPLRAKRWIRRKPPRRLKREGSDRAYLAWLHTQPCVVTGRQGTVHDPIEASHLRSLKHGSGMALKTKDRLAIPMLRSVHREYEQRKGRFAGWTQAEREGWHVGLASSMGVLFDMEQQEKAA